ncbi:MAG TPA: DUF1353 domain-containing protein [Candidatus Thioglobus sp.]|nr:DUF1353 domain-containing protein [Candidatus Thioglobus sp.]
MKVWSGKLDCSFKGETRWELHEELWFKSQEISKNHDIWKELGVRVAKSSAGYSRVYAKKGLDTDLASIPRFVWFFISPWDLARPSVIHDVLYSGLREALKNKTLDEKTIEKLRLSADQVFVEAGQQTEPPVAKWRINLSYLAIRAFGDAAIRKDGILQD